MAKEKTQNRRHRARHKEIDQRVRDELRRSLIALAINRVGRIIELCIRFGSLIAVVWAFAWAWTNTPEHLAGEETSVIIDVGLEILASKWAFLLICTILGAGWRIDHRALQGRISGLADENKRLQQLIDPRRTSSRMNPDGTSPEQ